MDIKTESTEWDDFDWPPFLTISGANYDAQLRAVYALLSRHGQWSSTTTLELGESESRTLRATGDRREWLVDQHIELIEQSIYEDAARSMAAVGMLAPLVESFFRRVSTVMEREWPRRGDVVETIIALVKEEQITPRSNDLEPTLRALFDYRNMMFHWGFEWPLFELKNFENRIRGANWAPDWFEEARQGNDPWIFYLSPQFIEHCLDRVKGIMEGICAFLVERGYDVW